MAGEPEKFQWICEMQDKGKLFCWVCGYDWSKFNTELRRYHTHHMERKSHINGKKKDGTPRYDDKRDLFPSCELCHDKKLATMPKAKQLAYKMMYDPDNYDLEGWLRLSDPELKAPQRVTQEEVEQMRLELLENNDA